MSPVSEINAGGRLSVRAYLILPVLLKLAAGAEGRALNVLNAASIKQALDADHVYHVHRTSNPVSQYGICPQYQKDKSTGSNSLFQRRYNVYDYDDTAKPVEYSLWHATVSDEASASPSVVVMRLLDRENITISVGYSEENCHIIKFRTNGGDQCEVLTVDKLPDDDEEIKSCVSKLETVCPGVPVRNKYYSTNCP